MSGMAGEGSRLYHRDMALKVGDPAPEFDVTSSDGRRLRLQDYRGKKNVVLYFYPADFTPVCTAEACGFRDMYADLQGQDTEVIGVSVDDDQKHEAFARKHNVPFPLVADGDLSLARTFDATGGLLSSLRHKTARITYVIGRDGRVHGVFDSAIFASRHLDGVRDTLRKLRDRA
jgi:thioredoxin-dependent peroxiredoxin